MIKKLLLKLFDKYRHSTVSRWYILAVDIFLFVCAFALAEVFATRSIYLIDYKAAGVKLFVMGIMTVLFFAGFGTYRTIMRHSGFNDVGRVVMACSLPLIICCVVNVVNNNIHPPIVERRFLLSYREAFILYSVLIVLMILFRMMAQRVYNEYFRAARPSENVMIYGAGAAGMIVMNALKQDVHTDYKTVCFIDDDKSKVNQMLEAVPVQSARQVLNEHFISRNKVSQLIIAIPTIRMSMKHAISNKALDLGLTVKSVPQIGEWINGTFSANQLQNIKIEDLLQREPIKLDNMNVVREVLDKVVMVTGAAGSIGSEICRQLIQYKPSKIIMLDQAETPMYDLQFELNNEEPYCKYKEHFVFVIANVKDKLRMDEVFNMYKPQVIYHAAAYKHVPFMEENPYEAIYVNVFGTKNVADLALKYGAQKFVMISTDKAVNPTNVMGATKRMAEIYIQSRSTDVTHFVTTRFGNVLGSNGSVIPLFKKQLAAGGPLTVTHKDIIRYFMTIPEACNLVMEAGAMGEGGDIFVFNMGKPVKIYDLAKRMIQLSGMKEIEIKEIGLRPGEKLYEELLATKENTIATYHPKIMRAKVRTYQLEDIDKEYAELWSMMPSIDDMKLVGKMKKIVPEFVSNNSVFCQLDEHTAKA